MIEGLKRLGLRGRGLLPSRLPKGSEEFDAFAASIFETYNLPDKPSYRHAIATMIMHLDPTEARKPKRYFAISIEKAMANQVAFEKIQELKKLEKEKADAEAKAAAESHQPEVTESALREDEIEGQQKPV